MAAMTTLPRGRELTVDDLAARPFGDAEVELVDGSLVVTKPGGFSVEEWEALPDDGYRYELLDGALLVTPTPRVPHQRVAQRLGRLLEDACPEELEAFALPLDVTIKKRGFLEPDAVVVRRSDAEADRLTGTPLLVVEILSPSTRRFDLQRKKDAYVDAGVRSYWVIDPDVPRLVAWEARDAAYVEVADVSGAEPFEAVLPYPVTIVPDSLVR